MAGTIGSMQVFMKVNTAGYSKGLKKAKSDLRASKLLVLESLELELLLLLPQLQSLPSLHQWAMKSQKVQSGQ
jgi:hypothetical protein